MEAAQIDTRRLAHELAAARPPLDPREQRLALTLYRLLAEGEPVTRGELAQHAGATDSEVSRLVDEQPGDDGVAVARAANRLSFGAALADLAGAA